MLPADTALFAGADKNARTYTFARASAVIDAVSARKRGSIVRRDYRLYATRRSICARIELTARFF